MEILTIAAVLCAYIVKGMCGFANTLVFSTIMSFSTTNIKISPLDLIVGYPSNILIAWKERKSVSAKICVPLSILVILGSIPGAIFLKNGNTQLIKTVFGFAVVLIGIEMLLREYQKKKKKSSRFVLGVIGIASGLLCGMYGIGAFLAAYVSRTTEKNSEFKGNISVVFWVENTFRIILYVITGIITWEVFQKALLLLPFMLVGLLIGMTAAKYTDEKIVKRIIIIMLIVSGISLILSSLGVF